MNRIDKFFAKEVEVKIGEDSYMLTPFTTQDLPLLNKLNSREEAIASKAQQELIWKVFKQIEPELTFEDSLKIEIKYVEDVMKAVSILNGVDMAGAKEKLLENESSTTEA